METVETAAKARGKKSVMEDRFTVSKLLQGRPPVVLSDKEAKCYEILEQLDIQFERVEYNRFPENETALAELDNAIGVKGIKNLFFKTKNSTQFFLIVLPRKQKLDMGKFREKYNVPKLQMADREDLEKLLHTQAGAVSVMELFYDKQGFIQLYIDRQVLKEAYFRFHPNNKNVTVRIKSDDLIKKLAPYLKHTIHLF